MQNDFHTFNDQSDNFTGERKWNCFSLSLNTNKHANDNYIRSLQVTWFKDNQPVEINRNGRLILSNENSLLIAQIEKIDAGNYTCVASNLAGTYSSEPAELVVHGKRRWIRREREKSYAHIRFVPLCRRSWVV